MTGRLARSLPAVLVLLAGTAFTAPAASGGGSDPYDLLEAARSHLRAGEVGPARDKLDELKTLIERTPEWDPDGSLAREVIPAMDARVRDIRRAVNRLDDLYRTVWVSRAPPERLVRTASVRAFLDWSTELVLELQQERDRIIESIPSSGDRAVVYETPSYERLGLVLSTGVVSRMSAFAAAVTAELEKEDERRRRLHGQLAALAADDPDRADERLRLVRDLDRSRQQIEQYLDAFAALVNEGVPARRPRDDPRARTVNDVFGSLLEQEIETVIAADSQTPSQQRERLADVERYRQVNSVLSGAAVSGDRTAEIDALARTIDHLPVVESEVAVAETPEAEAGTPGPALALAAALIAGLGGLVLWRRWWNPPAAAGTARVDAVIDDVAPAAADGSAPRPVAASETGDRPSL